MDAFPLSGRTFVMRQVFAAPDHPSQAVPTDEGVHPRPGDLRLEATLDPDARSGDHRASVQGSLAACVFDGLCWRRFDLSGLTGMHHFSNTVQLHALQRLVRIAAENAAGRTCLPQTIDNSRFLSYTLLTLPSPLSPGEPCSRALQGVTPVTLGDEDERA